MHTAASSVEFASSSAEIVRLVRCDDHVHGKLNYGPARTPSRSNRGECGLGWAGNFRGPQPSFYQRYARYSKSAKGLAKANTWKPEQKEGSGMRVVKLSSLCSDIWGANLSIVKPKDRHHFSRDSVLHWIYLPRVLPGAYLGSTGCLPVLLPGSTWSLFGSYLVSITYLPPHRYGFEADHPYDFRIRFRCGQGVSEQRLRQDL